MYICMYVHIMEPPSWKDDTATTPEEDGRRSKCVGKGLQIHTGPVKFQIPLKIPFGC